MDWNLLSIVPGIFCVVVFLVGLWFGAKLWKANNKFLALMVFIVDIGLAIGMYAIYWKRFFW